MPRRVARRTESPPAHCHCGAHDDRWTGVPLARRVPLPAPFWIRGARSTAHGRQRTPRQAVGTPVWRDDHGGLRYVARNVRRVSRYCGWPAGTGSRPCACLARWLVGMPGEEYAVGGRDAFMASPLIEDGVIRNLQTRAESRQRVSWASISISYIEPWSTTPLLRVISARPMSRRERSSYDSLRLPSALLADLKAPANKRDVPYQSLLKVFLADRVSRETRTKAHIE